jgi:KDO2-lipid IV(A) lauroyltransferase
MRREPLMRAGLWLLRQVARLPDRWVRRLGFALGEALWWTALPRRRIALTNLALCFPAMSDAERRRLARRHFRCFGAGFLECFVLWHEPAERIEQLVRQEGREHFDRHLGRPLILLAPHFVGLDAGGVRALVDSPGAAMFANQKSRALTEVMTRGRSRFCSRGMFVRNDGMRPVVRIVRAGVPFMLSPDMDLGPRDALFVPFFGVACATAPSLARLAAMTGAAVVPMITRMVDRGYVTTFLPAWEDFPGDDLAAATRRMNALIEHCVAQAPEQYLWTHRRFKTRPPGEPGLYRR